MITRTESIDIARDRRNRALRVMPALSPLRGNPVVVQSVMQMSCGAAAPTRQAQFGT